MASSTLATLEAEWHYLLDASHPYLPDWHIAPGQSEVRRRQ